MSSEFTAAPVRGSKGALVSGQCARVVPPPASGHGPAATSTQTRMLAEMGALAPSMGAATATAAHVAPTAATRRRKAGARLLRFAALAAVIFLGTLAACAAYRPGAVEDAATTMPLASSIGPRPPPVPVGEGELCWLSHVLDPSLRSTCEVPFPPPGVDLAFAQSMPPAMLAAVGAHIKRVARTHQPLVADPNKTCILSPAGVIAPAADGGGVASSHSELVQRAELLAALLVLNADYGTADTGAPAGKGCGDAADRCAPSGLQLLGIDAGPAWQVPPRVLTRPGIGAIVADAVVIRCARALDEWATASPHKSQLTLAGVVNLACPAWLVLRRWTATAVAPAPAGTAAAAAPRKCREAAVDCPLNVLHDLFPLHAAMPAAVSEGATTAAASSATRRVRVECGLLARALEVANNRDALFAERMARRGVPSVLDPPRCDDEWVAQASCLVAEGLHTAYHTSHIVRNALVTFLYAERARGSVVSTPELASSGTPIGPATRAFASVARWVMPVALPVLVFWELVGLLVRCLLRASSSPALVARRQRS